MAERQIETAGDLDNRMLALAVAKGTVARKLSTGAYATRTDGPDYITTIDTCTCLSFEHRGYCSHIALVRSLESEGGPDAPAPCWLCGDTRTIVDAFDCTIPCPICRRTESDAACAVLDAAAA